MILPTKYLHRGWQARFQQLIASLSRIVFVNVNKAEHMLPFTVTIGQLSVFINNEVIRAPFQDLWQVPLNFQERIFFILLWLPSPIRFDNFCEYSNLAIALFSVCKNCPLIDFVSFLVRFDLRNVVFFISCLTFHLNSSAWDLRIYKAATSVGAITS